MAVLSDVPFRYSRSGTTLSLGAGFAHFLPGIATASLLPLPAASRTPDLTRGSRRGLHSVAASRLKQADASPPYTRRNVSASYLSPKLYPSETPYRMTVLELNSTLLLTK